MKPTKAEADLPSAHDEAKHPLLHELANQQVFHIGKLGNHQFQISEMCDTYFAMDLTRAELRELADEIKRIADAP